MAPLVMWRVYKHPKDYREYVARKFVIKIFTGPPTSRLAQDR